MLARRREVERGLALLPEPHGRGLGHALAISGTEASMRNDCTVYVGLDVHKESITVAYAVDAGEVESLGKIGTTKTDIDLSVYALAIESATRARGL